MDDSDPGRAEATALRWFLSAQRASVLAIVVGLDAEHLTTKLLPSGWTPLGLVEHLGHAERYWFQVVTTGTAAPLPWSVDADDDDPAFTTTRPVESVFAFYRDQIERADAILDTRSMSSAPAQQHDIEGLEPFPDLRSVVLHMVEETARHAGHLDVVRELLDGRTGLGPR